MKYSARGTTRSPDGPTSTTDARSASSAGGVSPIGEPVPMLPPIVAPLRISRDANCGHSWSSSGTRPSSSRSASDSVSAAPSSTVSSVTVNVRSSVQPVDRDDERGADTADVDLDAPVGAARDHRRVRVLGQQRERVGEVGGPGEPARPGSGGAAGAGAAARAASASSAGGLPSAYAASRIGR